MDGGSGGKDEGVESTGFAQGGCGCAFLDEESGYGRGFVWRWHKMKPFAFFLAYYD